MRSHATRREFLRAAGAAGAGWGLADLTFLNGLPTVSAAEEEANPKLVKLSDEIEPLVRLLEETPRDKLLEAVAAKIRKGTGYREVLAALLLAGVRNVQPRPSVGFKFHAVLVVNSAHLASISSPDEHRWLPIFWALDYFKDAQAQTMKESGWRMGPANEREVPPAHTAREAFVTAMDNWDESAADAAIAGLTRTAGRDEVNELLFRYGCRDFRDIGHKAIYVANSLRTLSSIGWQYAEPVLRSLTYALLQHEGDNPAKRDAAQDHSGRRNKELAGKIRREWQEGKPDDSATRELLATLRTAEQDAVCDQVVELLNKGVAAQSIWDALHVGSGELLMRQPGIVGLHTLTSTNALHQAYLTAGNDETRRLLLLQNAAFLPQFLAAMKGRGKVGEGRLDQLEPLEAKGTEAEAVREIFADIGSDKPRAAKKVLAYAQAHADPKELIDAARVLVFMKGRDAHDYKFSSALLEDYRLVSPGWREKFLAAGVFQLRGSGGADNGLVERTRAALKG